MKKYLTIFLFFICLLFIIKPTIVLNGGSIVELEVNTKYKELGVEEKGLFINKNKLIIETNLDTKKVGTYKVKYKYGFAKLVRKIIVKDTTIPKIDFIGPDIINVCSLDNYIEPGYKSIDNYDGDITDNVKVERHKNKIIYMSKDSNNNIALRTRKLNVSDVEAPKININSPITIYKDSEYMDDTTITDNCDNNIKIDIDGSVDTSNIGEYKIRYEATDYSNNKTEALKIVNVVEKPLNEKIIYLTFDDGPSYSITPQLLDILKEENVKATFFVINHSDDLNYLIKREYDEGHSIGLHSSSHNYKLIYSSEEAYFNDLLEIQNKVESIIGFKPNIIRFPGGSSNTISSFNPGIMTRLAEQTTNKGYTYIDWNVSCEDAGSSRNSIDVYNNVIYHLNDKNNVVLMHDFEGNYKTLNAIRDIIKTARNLGYEFRNIDNTSPIIRHRISN